MHPSHFITTFFSEQYYTLYILPFNVFAIVFIFIACVAICKHLVKNAEMVEQNGRTVNEQKLSKNNLRLFLVIVTDFLCCIPICVTAFYFHFEDSYHSYRKS